MHSLDILKYGHLTFVKTLEGVSQADQNESGVCGVWSVKDITAHLASYEILLAEVLSDLLDGGATPIRDQWVRGPSAFNDDQVLSRHDKSATAVWAEYLETYDRVMALADRVAAEKWSQPGALPWYGAEYSLDDFIVYQYYGHKREHSAEIAVFLHQIAQRGAQ